MSEQKPIFSTRSAGEAFLVEPPDGTSGPGVLVLHSWWGLNDWTRDFCRRIADLGYTVLGPDLLEGVNPTSEAEAEQVLAERSPDELSGLVMSSARTLRAVAKDPNAPIAVVGLSMGASMALWLAARQPEEVAASIVFYGTQSIDFDQATATFQGHFGDADHMVSEEDRVVTESFLRLGDNHTEFHVYPGAKHWFMEDGENFDDEASQIAFERMSRFLSSSLT
ncbi:MAG: dienelactone hydrolase family protein [Acidimicrobiia bacterium]